MDPKQILKKIILPKWLNKKIKKYAIEKNKTYNEMTNAMLEEYFEQDPQVEK